LATCPNCDALNDVTASVCHKCAATLSSSQTPALALASAHAHATDNNAERSAHDIARAHYLQGSYTTTTDASALKHYAPHPSATPGDFKFAGSDERPALTNLTLARNRILIAVLSFIGIVCVALSAYLYLATNLAERAAARESSTRAPVDAGVKNPITTPSAETARGTVQGPTNAVAPITERSASDVASRIDSNSPESGKPPSTPTPACTEVVYALGLCPPQAVQGR